MDQEVIDAITTVDPYFTMRVLQLVQRAIRQSLPAGTPLPDAPSEQLTKDIAGQIMVRAASELRQARRDEHRILAGLNEQGINNEELLHRMAERYKELTGGADA